MILSNKDIMEAINRGELIINPHPEPSQYTTSALDLRVGDAFWKYKKKKKGIIGVVIDFDEITETADAFRNISDFLERIPLDDDGTIILKQEAFILARSYEHLTLPTSGKLAARVEGRSSLARLGISVHMTAPIIHNGFSGRIFLEVVNKGPFNLRIRPNKTRLCQVVFEQVSSVPSGDLSTYFKDQDSPTGKR